MKLSQILLLAVFVAVVAAIVGGIVFRDTSIPVEAAPAVRGPITQFVDERGQTTLPREYLITMPFEGRIEPITLEAGDTVDTTTVVARIVQSDIDQTIAETEAQVEQLRASIAESEDTSIETIALEQANHFVQSMGLTVEAAQERIAPSEARLQFARSQLDRTEELFGRQVTSQEELDRARVEATEAESGYRQDMLTWRTAQAVEAATVLLPSMIETYMNLRKPLGTDVLQAQLAEAEARLAQMKTRQQRSVMLSPVAGVVLERLETNERFLPAGELLLRIGQLNELEVEADVLSQEVVDIREGDRTIIYGPAVGSDVENGVPGSVGNIHPAGFTKVSSLGVEQQRVTVVVDFEPEALAALREHRELGVDYRVRVRIITDARDDALIVPRSALFRGPAGGWQVLAIRGGKADLTNVEVGLMNDDIAEILSGVEEGEQVILAPESSVTDGVRVKRVESSYAAAEEGSGGE